MMGDTLFPTGLTTDHIGVLQSISGGSIGGSGGPLEVLNPPSVSKF